MWLACVALASLVVVPREWWDPDVPPHGLRDRTQAVRHLVVHHSSFSQPVGPLDIKRYHQQERGFGDIAYHYVVHTDGTIYEGRLLRKIGAHAGVVMGQTQRNHKDPDDDSIGIVLDGDWSAVPPPFAQLDATARLLQMLRARYALPPESIVLHRHVQALVEQRGDSLASEPTECPGDGAASWLWFLRVFSAATR
jgi:N-acetyl-anhydromuramyl-L-alanine amidase AmpD